MLAFGLHRRRWRTGVGARGSGAGGGSNGRSEADERMMMGQFYFDRDFRHRREVVSPLTTTEALSSFSIAVIKHRAGAS